MAESRWMPPMRDGYRMFFVVLTRLRCDFVKALIKPGVYLGPQAASHLPLLLRPWPVQSPTTRPPEAI